MARQSIGTATCSADASLSRESVRQREKRSTGLSWLPVTILSPACTRECGFSGGALRKATLWLARASSPRCEPGCRARDAARQPHRVPVALAHSPRTLPLGGGWFPSHFSGAPAARFILIRWSPLRLGLQCIMRDSSAIVDARTSSPPCTRSRWIHGHRRLQRRGKAMVQYSRRL